jgi:hypothetical protein
MKTRRFSRAATITVVIIAILNITTTPPLLAEGLPPGKATAEEAAAPNLTADRQTDDLHGWSYGYAFTDTTGYDFPEEDEKSTMQLVREVTLWLVVAGFIAFFIIKVFLEGDKDEEPTDGSGGKVIPPLAATVTPPPPEPSSP